jgi:ABC-type uncharacterized transport system ATPase subunit
MNQQAPVSQHAPVTGSGPGHEPVIRAERLAKSYGRRRGLDGLDLEVRAAEVFGYLGPNGAGKTIITEVPLKVNANRHVSAGQRHDRSSTLRRV